MEMVLYFDLSYTLRFNMMVLFLLLNESVFMDPEWRHSHVLKSIYGLSNNMFSCITRFPIAEIAVAAYLRLVSPSFYFGRVELRIVIELLQFQESVWDM